MAIERLAVFALSVAFSTSLVLYPDLPPDIPPRAGRDGPFVGAPFVAFFFPCAALVLWWLVATLSQRSRTMAARAVRAGAVAAFFLSAFHVTMLIAFVGGQSWLVRVLGALVGAFLVVTGNDLPRARPVLVWGAADLGTRKHEGPSRVWNGRRLAGYTRVSMGVTLCAAALLGVPGFVRLIVVAACAEVAIRITSGALRHRERRAVIGGVLASWCAVGAHANAQEIPHERIEAVPAFMDATVPKLMDEGHVPGTAVAVVHRGHVVFLRGYGQAQVESGIQVDPSRTLFRIGSVSKTLTAIAVLQLVDAGMLDLQRDIRTYMPDVPLRYGATMHQLLTHTAGLDERFAGAYTDWPDQLEPLSAHVRHYPPEQVLPPGTIYSYSNYHYALAGAVIERLSGMTYEQYMAERVFGPLAMSATAYQPPALPLDRAQGYEWRTGRQIPLPSRLTFASPSGGISATASDMTQVLLALLGDGSVDGRRILSPESVRAMLAPQYTPDPRIPAAAYGFTHWMTHGQLLLHKDGTLGDQIGVLVLAPASGLGIFAASNAVPGVANALLEPLLIHLFGPETPPAAPTALPDATNRTSRVAGTYQDYHHTRNDMSRPITLMLQSRATAEPDGSIRWRNRRWLEVAPLVFTSADGRDTIVFRENASGEIAALHAWGATYERIGWTEQAAFHLLFLATCVIGFLAYPLASVLPALRRRIPSTEGCAAHRCAVIVAVANLTFVAWLAVSFRGLGASVPLPRSDVLWLSIPLASGAITALLPGFTVFAWLESWWTRRERLGYSTFAALAVAFMVFLNYWKILGVRY